jgi:hypothetical protein
MHKETELTMLVYTFSLFISNYNPSSIYYLIKIDTQNLAALCLELSDLFIQTNKKSVNLIKASY